MQTFQVVWSILGIVGCWVLKKQAKIQKMPKTKYRVYVDIPIFCSRENLSDFRH